MRRVGLGLVLATLSAVLVPSAASAQAGPRQAAELRFTERQPGAPSGLTLRIDYVNPADPDGKPPAVRTVVEELAQGARIDTGVPALCTATDAQLMLQGPGACPAGSAVGTGSIRIDTGLPEPARFIDADVIFLNNTGQLIFVSTDRQSGARLVTRSSIEGGRIVNSAPPLPGTPPDGGAIDVVEVDIEPVSREVGGVIRGYVTTPGGCPASGAWTNSIAFTYADGVNQGVSSASPCDASLPLIASEVLPIARERPLASAGKKCKLKKRKHKAAGKGKRGKHCKKKR